jgi:hypothetical protein
MKLHCLSGVAMMLACTFAFAAEPQEKTGNAAGNVLPPVTVKATRDPVDKSYRKIVKGMDLFEAKHSLAPAATLRYKLLPRQHDTKMEGIALNVVGDTVTIPVPVAADHTFTLDRQQKALDENASVIPNRKAGSMTWRADIRTPGLPPGTRRLGDLRLECEVGIAADLVSNTRPGIGQIANFVTKMLDYCNTSEVHYYFFAERPLFSVTLVASARREVLPVDELYAGASHDPSVKAELPYCDCQVLLDRTYFMPLGDHTWPDDTLVEFEYMDDDNGREAPPAAAFAPANKALQ